MSRTPKVRFATDSSPEEDGFELPVPMLDRLLHRSTVVTSYAVNFAVDSLLEEAVLSELVSEAKFPASWENTGNFVRLGLRVRLLARNPGTNSMAYDPIPYASEQGIYFGLAGN
jgi:hypothetical protein